MAKHYTGTSASQLYFQEHIYQLMEQGVPFICSSAHLRAQVQDPEAFMEYLDPVTAKMRWNGQPDPKNFDFPPRWFCTPVYAAPSNRIEPVPA